MKHMGVKIAGIKIVLTGRQIKLQRLTLSYERKKRMLKLFWDLILEVEFKRKKKKVLFL